MQQHLSQEKPPQPSAAFIDGDTKLTLYRRLMLADQAWRDLMAASKEAALKPSPMSGAIMLTYMRHFLAMLLKDVLLRNRAADDFETQILDERPAKVKHDQGVLFEGGRRHAS